MAMVELGETTSRKDASSDQLTEAAMQEAEVCRARSDAFFPLLQPYRTLHESVQFYDLGWTLALRVMLAPSRSGLSKGPSWMRVPF